MKSKTAKALALLLSFQTLFQTFIFAQGITVPEEVKQKCNGVPFESRLGIKVYKFSNSVSGVDSKKIDNFSTMLTNALFQINCFDVKAEDKDTLGMNKSKRIISDPDVIAFGEIIEYYYQTKSTKVAFSKKTVYTAHIGFNLRIVDNKTQSVVFTGSFNKEAEAVQKSSSINIKDIVKKAPIPGTPIETSSDDGIDKAYADALEKSILDAVTGIVNNKDNIQAQVKSLKSTGAKENTPKETTITITNTSFLKNSDLETALKGLSNVSNVEEPTLIESQGTIIVTHNGSTNELAKSLILKLSQNFEITSVTPGKISIKVK